MANKVREENIPLINYTNEVKDEDVSDWRYDFNW